MGKEPETQASSDMERVRMRVYDGSGHPENGSQGRRRRRLCRSEILDGRIFPSPAPHSKKRWLFGHLFLPQINETEQPYSGIPSPSQFILQFF